MNVLMVESVPELGSIWAEHLARSGARVFRVRHQDEAEDAINKGAFNVIVLDLKANGISFVTLSDLATFRNPHVAIIGVSADDFFSDGSIFNLVPNMCGVLGPTAHPDDMAAMVEHYGSRALAPLRLAAG